MNIYEITYVKNGEQVTDTRPAESEEDAIEKVLDEGIEVIVDVQLYARLGKDE